MGSLSLLQEVFPVQGSNPGLPHYRWILYQLSHKGSLIFIVIIAKRQSISWHFFDQFSKRPWLPKSLLCFKSEMIGAKLFFFLFPMVHIWVLGHTYDVVKLYSCSEIVLYELPRWHSGKELPANTEDSRDSGLIPGSGRSSRIGNGILLQYSSLENPLDRGACRLQSMRSQTVRYHWATEHKYTVYFMVP